MMTMMMMMMMMMMRMWELTKRGSKVTICHIPPGNLSNAQTITVGASAVNAHLNHGDTLGECDEDEERIRGR